MNRKQRRQQAKAYNHKYYSTPISEHLFGKRGKLTKAQLAAQWQATERSKEPNLADIQAFQRKGF